MRIDDLFIAITSLSQRDPSLRAFVIGTVAFVGALWIGLIVWTARDVTARTRNAFARVLAVLVVFALHIFGFFVYLLFRPAQTIEERDELRIEHDLLRQAAEPDEVLDTARRCLVCGTVIADSFKFCPECRTEIRRACGGCGQLLELAWKNCPYCGRAVVAKSSRRKAS
jgi:RNA polymerase subunit RPABC4/transcription elongation factor Spt4/F0F1-type ATP synthase membrane subunit c/vacuolar-type H+-ATPase subunit K